MSNKKIIGITIGSVVLYTFFLFCIGLFGTTLQNYAITGGFYALKYGSVLLGFFITGYMPYRINKAMIKRKELKYQLESERKIQAAAQAEKEKQEKILEQMYIKNEDAI